MVEQGLALRLGIGTLPSTCSLKSASFARASAYAPGPPGVVANAYGNRHDCRNKEQQYAPLAHEW